MSFKDEKERRSNLKILIKKMETGLKEIKHRIMMHECTLPAEEDLIVRYIDSGWFVYFRRKFRQFLMVSEHHAGGRSYLKSGFTIEHEKARQLKFYYYMIHPFSLGRYVQIYSSNKAMILAPN